MDHQARALRQTARAHDTPHKNYRCAALRAPPPPPPPRAALTRAPGICFGHQIVARALGGEVVPNGGKWEVGVTPMQLTELGKRIFRTQEAALVRRSRARACVHRDP
jgi:hypothetical protein